MNTPTSLKPMTYEEWIAANPDVEQTEQDCPKCNGDGTEECWACGQDVDCDECNGTGVINSARQQYEEQRKKDEAALKRYKAYCILMERDHE